MKDLIEEGLRAVIDDPPHAEKPAREAQKRVSVHDLMKHLIFENAEGPTDLSTNPKYFDDFGR